MNKCLSEYFLEVNCIQVEGKNYFSPEKSRYIFSRDKRNKIMRMANRYASPKNKVYIRSHFEKIDQRKYWYEHHVAIDTDSKTRNILKKCYYIIKSIV